MSPAHYNQIETGRVLLPAKRIPDISEALNVSVDELVDLLARDERDKIKSKASA